MSEPKTAENYDAVRRLAARICARATGMQPADADRYLSMADAQTLDHYLRLAAAELSRG
jgi:hypothetical protein